MVSPHVPMIARATSRAPLLAVRNRTRRIRSLFVMAEKKQKATPDKAVKHKYPLEVCSLCLDPPQVFDKARPCGCSMYWYHMLCDLSS